LGRLIIGLDRRVSSGVGNRTGFQIHPVAISAAGFLPGTRPSGSVHFSLDMARVQQVQLLPGRRAIISFPFQPGVARRPPKKFQKGTRDAPVRQRDRALTFRNERKGLRIALEYFSLVPRDLVHRVDEHLRFQPAHG
jgi:hypothetical protein